MSKTDFEERREAIKSIPNEETIDPNMPVAIAVQEGEDLYEWAKDEEDKLVEAGLDADLLHDIPGRAGALRYTQSIWQKEYNTYEEAQEEWSEKAPEAFDLRDVIVHDFLHAYRNDPDLLSKVRQIAEGSGNADMLQDLSDLSILGRDNPGQLEKITFDMTKLDRADNYSETLSETLAKANGLRTSDHAEKIMRDKAFTYLKKAVDEVRHHGQYKFWRDESRRKGYASRYFRRKNTKTGDDKEN